MAQKSLLVRPVEGVGVEREGVTGAVFGKVGVGRIAKAAGGLECGLQAEIRRNRFLGRRCGVNCAGCVPVASDVVLDGVAPVLGGVAGGSCLLVHPASVVTAMVAVRARACFLDQR